jgi:pimeloyl-ACP methyl ester carboxylesterase
MQQQIGFCTTADGARIAYATVGTGPALVVASPGHSHLGLEWEEPRVRDFWETVGQHHMVVRYDRQGCGLSDRNRSDFSLEAEIRTIEAIVKKLGLKSFVLLGPQHGGPLAIGYAVEFPDHVSHLILYGAQARWLPNRPGMDVLRALVRSNWRMAQLAMAEIMLGRAFDAAALQWYLRRLQEGVSPEMLDELMVAHVYNMDVRDLLPRVSVPTLVVQYRNSRAIPFEVGRVSSQVECFLQGKFG